MNESKTELPYREGQELLVKAKFKYFNESIQEAVLSIGADDCQQKVFVPIEKLSEIVQPEDALSGMDSDKVSLADILLAIAENPQAFTEDGKRRHLRDAARALRSANQVLF